MFKWGIHTEKSSVLKKKKFPGYRSIFPPEEQGE